MNYPYNYNGYTINRQNVFIRNFAVIPNEVKNLFFEIENRQKNEILPHYVCQDDHTNYCHPEPDHLIYNIEKVGRFNLYRLSGRITRNNRVFYNQCNSWTIGFYLYFSFLS